MIRFYDMGDYIKGDKVVTPEQLREMIGADNKMLSQNEETNKLENIVHGQNVCAHVDRGEGKPATRRMPPARKMAGWSTAAITNIKTVQPEIAVAALGRVTIPKESPTITAVDSKTPATCEGEGEKNTVLALCAAGRDAQNCRSWPSVERSLPHGQLRRSG